MDKFRVHLIEINWLAHIYIFHVFFFLLFFITTAFFFLFVSFFLFFYETDTNTFFSIHTAMNQKALFTSLDKSIPKATNYLISNDNRIV